MRRTATVALLALTALLAACTSPEATRTRGGGRGADVDNHGSIAVIHGGADPYWHTPHVIIMAGSNAGERRR